MTIFTWNGAANVNLQYATPAFDFRSDVLQISDPALHAHQFDLTEDGTNLIVAKTRDVDGASLAPADVRRISISNILIRQIGGVDSVAASNIALASGGEIRIGDRLTDTILDDGANAIDLSARLASVMVRGLGGADTIAGGDGDDRVLGETGADRIEGGKGGDSIFGGQENDALYGGAGNDWLVGDSGDDLLYGGADDDTLFGDNGKDTVFITGVDAGDDVFYGGGQDDYLGITFTVGDHVAYLGDGDDRAVLEGNPGDLHVRGDDGNDTLGSQGQGSETLDGGAGADAITSEAGSVGAKTLIGGAGDDTIAVEDASGDAENAILPFTATTTEGGGGDDTVDYARGLFLPDANDGGKGNDRIAFDRATILTLHDKSISNFETIDWSDDSDSVLFADGNNTRSTPGAVVVNGNAGDDFIEASRETASSYALFGGEGADTLKGGAGADSLRGGNGSDLLVGNGGSDTFQFLESWNGSTYPDVIQDFTGNYDRMVFDGNAFAGMSAIDGYTGTSGAGATAADNLLINAGFAHSSIGAFDDFLAVGAADTDKPGFYIFLNLDVADEDDARGEIWFDESMLDTSGARLVATFNSFTAVNQLAQFNEGAGGNNSGDFIVGDVIGPAVSAPDLATASDKGWSPADNITSVTAPVFTGTGEVGATIQLLAGAATLGGATVDGSGAWSVTAEGMADGEYAVFAVATDAAGNRTVSDTLDVVIDTTAATVSAPDLDPASDSGVSTADDVTNDQTPTFTGTGEAGAVVELRSGMATLGSTTVDEAGNWSITSQLLAPGERSIFARIVDAAGNSADGATLTVTIDTTPPANSAPDLVASSDHGASSTDNITNDATPTFSGTAEIGATVRLFEGAALLGETTVDGSGAWSITATELADGKHRIWAEATDEAGNFAFNASPTITIDTTIGFGLDGAGPRFGVVTGAGSGFSQAYDVAIDGAGNSYLFGGFSGTVDFDPSAGTAELTALSPLDYFLARYDADGALDWAIRTGARADTAAVFSDGAIALDGSGNAYVTGIFRGTVDFDPGDGSMVLAAAGASRFVSKYDADGGLDWAFQTESALETPQIGDIAVDPSGNVFVAGSFFGPTDFDPGPGTVEPAYSHSDFFLARYDAGGTLAWVVDTHASSDNEHVNGVAVDAAGNSYIVGAFNGTADFDPGPGTTQLVATGTNDLFVAKFDPAGELVWAKGVGPSSSQETGWDIAVDGSGNVLVVGEFNGTVDFDSGPGTVQLVASSRDFFVAKYDAAGDLAWARNPGASGGYEYGLGIAVDDAGNAYATGYFMGTADFDSGARTLELVATNEDYYTLKYDPDGTLLWVTTPGSSTSDERARAIAVDGEGNSYFAGEFAGSVDFDPGEGDAAHAPPGTQFFLAALTPAGDLGGTSTLAPFALDPASDSGASDSDHITNVTTPTFVGTGEVGAAVTLFSDTVALGTATVAGDGTWAIETDSLGAGTYTVFARIADAAGNTADSDTIDLVIDTVATVSAPDLDAASDGGASSVDNITDDVTPSFSGTGEVGAVVHLVAGAETLGTTTVDGAGDWSIGVDTLSDGDYVVFARTVDLAGNSGDGDTLGFTIDTGAPTVSAPDLEASSDSGASSIDNITSDPTPSFAGTGDPGAVVHLVAGGDTLGSTTVDGSGDWTVVADTLTDGDYTAFARIVDAAGNSADGATLDFTIDTGAPTVSAPDLEAASDSGVSSIDNITADTTPAFSGTGEAGAVIHLVAGGDTLGSATVDGSGDWSIVTGALADGDYTAFARIVDAAGNGADGATLDFTIDTGVPTVSAPDLEASSDSGASSVDNITNDATPSFAGTGEVGAVVHLIAGGDTLGSTTVGGTGKWTVLADALDDGTYSAFARIVDAAGNNADGATLSFTIDTVAPGTTVDAAPAGTETVNAASFAFSSDDTQAAFEAKLDGGSFAAVDSTHSLSGLTDGPHTLVVRAVDLAGNLDPTAETVVWSIDAGPPDTFILDGPDTLTTATAATFDFGSDRDGVSYEAKLDGGDYEPVADPAAFSGLADGPHTLLVRAKDGDGNADESPATYSWTVDASPPAAPTIVGFSEDTGEQGDRLTTDTTPTLRGTAEPGTTIHILRDGIDRGMVAVDDNGEWSWTDPGVPGPGARTYAAVAVDAAGNAGPASEPLLLFIATAGSGAGNGADLIPGQPGSGSVDGKEGDDTIFGEAGNDTVKGGNGADLLFGGGDHDATWGGNGNDTAAGGPGNDTLYGETGMDSLDGGDGADRLDGGTGDDVLAGGAGADTIVGGDGVDSLFGGAGADRLSGDGLGDWIVLGTDGAKDTVIGTVAHLSGDIVSGFDTGRAGDVFAITGLSSANGKYLDSVAILDGVLSLSKVGGGVVTFEDLEGIRHTDTMLGSDGAILIYIV
ncbi:MAG: Ig-like domain-containing protein [Alphaproteobacteria bacterium]